MTLPAFRVQVVDQNIVVTLPGYSYAVTYYKPRGTAGLLMKYSVTTDDLRLEMTAAEFFDRGLDSRTPKRVSWAGLSNGTERRPCPHERPRV